MKGMKEMTGSLAGKVVIITGGANGIGRGIAKAFVEKQAIVCIADKDEKMGEEVVLELEGLSGKAAFYKTDVREEEEILNLVECVVNDFGKINILINNAGVSRFKPLFELTTAEWEDVVFTNLRSVFIGSREAARRMEAGGRIINIASTRATMSEPNSEAYASSKGGIVALTHALAASLQEKGIAVNSISPGWIQTEDYDELREKDHLQHWSNRVGKPEDIAKACLYLADPDNEFINGQDLVIDGGMTRKMIYEE
ncbi:oxidoreductase, short chain dehydrogenase/reductase family [Mesobacillus selenatarsenatis SF-1]|uniref:Oxidoreductase, short chain dehydrogenase/reductase family n=2 Tax=Mesobacillus selenatarsenatis TaxID=388741 RepID=A0A0A8X6I9_MESS1|nr:oxidoreductase, short chain dehydrogenase/reductase family [Mesobacillus selenatarsenatis SF-1]